MRELNAHDIEQVCGGSDWVMSTGALVGPIVGAVSADAGFVTASFFGGYQFGKEINSTLSTQTQSAIGYTTNQFIYHPINSIETAFDYWF